MSHDTFQSPFTWRYGSGEMRALWSEVHKRKLWRRIWLALAEAQMEWGITTADQVDDLRRHVDDVDVDAALAIEAEIQHDLMAELRAFAAQCPAGGGILHAGATSMDIEDNADVLRMRDSLDLILSRLDSLLRALAGQIEKWAKTAAIAYTHLQPAEPTTVGYRLAQYGQDLLMDRQELARVRAALRGKGLKGAVGTSASYADLTGAAPEQLEQAVMRSLNLAAFDVSTQTYPRKQDWLVVNALAGLGMSLFKLCFDLRILQSPSFGEWAEPFGARQVGSSAMPFKRNPIRAEKVDSLARYLAQLPRVAWDNGALSLLERTLDDSANRRVVLPEAFLCADELLLTASRIAAGLIVDQAAVARNLARYAPFAATERLLMAGIKAGADRQAWHEIIREHAMEAWRQVASGEINPLVENLCADARITGLVDPTRIRALLDLGDYVGDAPRRALGIAAKIRDAGIA